MTIASDKAALRSALLEARRDRSSFDLALARMSIAARIASLAREQGWGAVAAYRPLATEPGSDKALELLRAEGVRVITPVLLEDRDLDWTTEPGAADRLGVEAIGSVDAILLPALAVGRAGMRLGRGGGSYDRVLARVHPRVPTYALLFDGELLDEVPTDPWDRPVRWVIMPSGVIPVGGVDAE